MKLFGPRSCVGIDAGGKDLKVVELRRAGSKYEVVQAARIELGRGTAPEAVGEALGEFLAQTRTRAAHAVFSLPSSECCVKFAEVPRARPADLAKVVRFEAESQIPLPLGDVVWDFTADGDRSSSLCAVTIAAAKKSAIESLLSIASAAGLRPAAVLVSAIAGAKAVACPDAHGGPVLVADIGREWMDLVAVDDGSVFGTRSVRIGGADLTEAFAHDFRVGSDEAERLKRTRGFSVAADAAAKQTEVSAIPDAADSSVQLWARRIGEEILRSLVSLSGGGRRPQRVILTGGLAGVPGMAVALSRAAGLPVEIGDPWAGMRLTQVSSRTVREPSAAFAVATGLARAGLDRAASVNLMPRHIAAEQRRRRREVAAVAGMGATSLALLIALIVGAPEMASEKAELARLSAKVQEARRQVRRASVAYPEAAAVSAMVKQVERADINGLELLRSLSENMPRSVWLSEFSFESDKSVVLKGGALSNAAVADAVDALSMLEVFDSVALDYSNLSSGEDAQGYDFQITCALRPGKGGISWSKVGAGNKSVGQPNTGIVVQ